MLRVAYYVTVLEILLSVNVISDGYSPYDIPFSGDTGDIFILRGYSSMTLSCKQHNVISEAFPPFNDTFSIKDIGIYACKPPTTSYSKELNALNINTTALQSLSLFFNETEELLQGNYTEGLDLKNLHLEKRIKGSRRIIFSNNPDFLKPLANLSFLAVDGLEMPPLPTTAKISELTLNGASVKQWGYCKYIRQLVISQLEGEVPIWSEDCNQLDEISLSSLSPEIVESIARRFQGVVGNLRTLDVNLCRLFNIPLPILLMAKNLTELDLSDNNLDDVSLSQFPVLDKLQKLILHTNKINLNGDILGGVLRQLPSLRVLDLGYNEVLSSCVGYNNEAHARRIIDALEETKIEDLSFRGTDVKIDCFKDSHFSKLEHIYLGTDLSHTFKISDIPKTNASRLKVEFSYTQFEEILFDKTNYEELQKRNKSFINGNIPTNVTIVQSHITCDCKHYWLRQAMIHFPNLLNFEDLKCNHEYGTRFLEAPAEDLECDKWEENSCTFRKRWRDERIVAQCEQSKKIPSLESPVHGLNMSRNYIEVLHLNLPDTLKWIDLRHNRISRANNSAAAALFANGRRVWLDDNLLDCECDNDLLDTILHHRDQVEDFLLLTCAGNGRPLSEVSMAVLCQVPLKVSLWLIGIAVAVAAAAALVWWRYGEPIKIFLFTRGVCLWCIRQPDLDDDMEWDAFLSFAHGDEQFVCEQLLPGLEGAPERFRVCVHYRDWVVGDWIPEQIMRSVHASKRTLILLSRNFVRSTWSSLEFRYAMAHAAQRSGLSRLLVLVLDDVLQQPLDAELTAYLTYNTYLRCDDPWFWEKLRYALPHRSKSYKLKPYVRSEAAQHIFRDVPARLIQMEMDSMTQPDTQPTLD